MLKAMQKSTKWMLICGLLALMACHKPVYEPTFSVCTNVENYPALAAAGYDYIEPSVGNLLMPAESDSAFRVKLDEVKAMGAKMVSCTIFLPGSLKVVGEETHPDEINAWAEIAFKRAQEAGVPYIVFGSGRSRRVPEGFSKEEGMQQFIAVCKNIAPIAQRYNVTVLVEPLNTGETNLVNSLAEGVQIVKGANHPNIQLLCDIYHMMRENEPASEIVKYGQYIRHCHIAEKEKRTAPGTVGDDFTPYFKALKEIDYAGCISIEGGWDDMETRLPLALQYMKEQYAAE